MDQQQQQEASEWWVLKFLGSFGEVFCRYLWAEFREEIAKEPHKDSDWIATGWGSLVVKALAYSLEGLEFISQIDQAATAWSLIKALGCMKWDERYN